MEVKECILKRRSIRKFMDAPISGEIILDLLECAMAAPSACNKRPWEFYVIRENSLLEKFRSVSRYSNYVSPLILVVCGNTHRALSKKENDFWIQDCTAAIENILLRACSLGLGTCWCGLYPMLTPVKRTRELLELPEHIIPHALIHIGYPAEAPEPRTQYQEKFVHYHD